MGWRSPNSLFCLVFRVGAGQDTRILQGDRPYEGMNLPGVTRLTPTMIPTIKALEAVD
ncbi:hypothetical protein H6G76_01525 [Nostoc sp. FACHB-152]|uniref:hypothetical protein n=1 Tax=unclassified Nostoc TaxID=2593658 RepID=UPI001687F78B|nr:MULTISPECIES: hypothetical protein [unclassified Nostoc]MBD2445851.1 hypothetical protein [Nostoc sp. FACHB-152]MBD2467973.1 hypothetical protein [Nostoc sp. FACHB-145]